MPKKAIRELVVEILILTGREHPQPLMYSLIVAAKPRSVGHPHVLEVINRLKRFHPELVSQVTVAQMQRCRHAS